MKVSDLLTYDTAVLAKAVKLSQRKKLVNAAGQGWKEWVEAQPTGKKLSDPRRYSTDQLAAFLASLEGQQPDPRAPDKAVVKPRKLLKQYLPWLAKRTQEDKSCSGAAAKQDKSDRVWQLLQRTRSHPRFKHLYSFDSFYKGWLCTDRVSAPGDAADTGSAPAPASTGAACWRLLGLDCEMCVTADRDKELLQVAVVDEKGEVIFKELVCPTSEVLDYKTELTGISAADLEGVTLTRKAVAKRIHKLLTPSTVLVGHSLHYDLEALMLDHHLVIDTSMIFSYQGLAQAAPSLKHLAEQLLGRQLRCNDPSDTSSSQQQQRPHDSVEDAATSMALVQMELQLDSPTPPLQSPGVKVEKSDLAKLCVHRLPAATSSGSSPAAAAATVKASLAAACRETGAAEAAAAIESCAVEQPGNVSKQLMYLVFQHAGVANDVFAALPGAVFSDSVGRHSKHQELQGTGHKVVVRRMACHSGLAFGKDKPVDRGQKKKPSAGSKRKAGSKAGPGAAAAAAKHRKKQAMSK